MDGHDKELNEWTDTYLEKQDILQVPSIHMISYIYILSLIKKRTSVNNDKCIGKIPT